MIVQLSRTQFQHARLPAGDRPSTGCRAEGASHRVPTPSSGRVTSSPARCPFGASTRAWRFTRRAPSRELVSPSRKTLALGVLAP